VNSRGELVGINTAIYSQSGGYQGIGFAVPSNVARRVMNDLIQYGEVRRGSIGYVVLAPMTTHVAEELGAPGPQGALVRQMRRDSAAYEAGVRPGDIIISFNGQAVVDPAHFSRLVQDARIGSTAALGIFREGRKLEVRVPIEQRGGRQ
jgi:S1-C subfamily serine protease